MAKDSFELHLENVYNAQLAQESASAAAGASEGGLAEKVGAGAAAGSTGVVEGVVKPVARGVITGAANTLRTGEWLARDLFGIGKNQPSVGEFIANQVEADKEAQGGQNVGQDLIQGVAQFFTGLKGAKGAGAVMNKVPGASKASTLGAKAMSKFPGRVQQTVRDATAGTAASGIAFDPTEERLGMTAVTGLADMAGADPALMNTLKAYLLGSKDDPESLARVKALIGDAFTGVVASPVFRQGAKMGGKAIKAVSDWLGNMAQQERSALPPAPAPTAPPNPKVQSVAREYQSVREAPDMPRRPLHPATLELAEQKALSNEANVEALIKDVEDQLVYAQMHGVELEFKPTQSLLPELNDLAPNGHTWATILEALHQKFGYEMNGISDPMQAWATHGWMFSAESMGAFTQHVRGMATQMTRQEDAYLKGVNDRTGRLNAEMGKFGQPPLPMEGPGPIIEGSAVGGSMGPSIPPKGTAKALRNDPAIIQAQEGMIAPDEFMNRGEIVNQLRALGIPDEILALIDIPSNQPGLGRKLPPNIAGGKTVEEAAGPLAHTGRPVTMPKSRVRPQVEPDEVVKKVETEMAGQPADKIEAEINRRLMPGETRVFEDTVFDGKRMGSVMGPNDNMVVIEKGGKDAGFLWYTREPEGGFTVRKVEVKPEFQRQGLASQLYDEVEKVEGSYKGATDLTPEGKAFKEGRDAKKKAQAETGYRPEVEGILGVPETAREGVQQAIQQKAQQMGLGPIDLQNVILAIDALKEN